MKNILSGFLNKSFRKISSVNEDSNTIDNIYFFNRNYRMFSLKS